jgi:hypothetical protein
MIAVSHCSARDADVQSLLHSSIPSTEILLDCRDISHHPGGTTLAAELFYCRWHYTAWEHDTLHNTAWDGTWHYTAWDECAYQLQWSAVFNQLVAHGMCT